MAACITLTPLLNADNTPADDPQLPTVHVTAVHINEDELCTGHACFGLFGPGTVTAPLPGEISLVDPEESRPEGELGEIGRESAVFSFYRDQLYARYAGYGMFRQIMVERADNANRANGGAILTISFSNGSQGEYRRTDSGLNGTHGFDQQAAPNCG